MKRSQPTDFADTYANRFQIRALAAWAQVLSGEVTFLAQDRAQAERADHLTARACGEIAAAGVRYLIPFHFSHRSKDAPWRVYDEVAAACPQTVVPRLAHRFSAA